MRSLAYLLLAITAFSWAGNAIAGRVAAGAVSPMTLTTLRWSVAVLAVLPFAWPYLKRDAPLLRASWKPIVALGACGFTLFNVLLYSSLEIATAINIVLIQAGLPAIIFGLNFLVFHRTVVPLQIVGFALSLAGVALVMLGGGDALGGIGLGELLGLLAVIVYASYTVGLSAKPHVHWLSLLAAMAAAALVVSLPFTAWEALSGNANWPDGPRGWGVVVYAGLFPALIAQACFIRAIDMIGSNRAGMVVNVVPVLGTTMAVLFLGEAFRWHHGAALVLTMGGIALAEWAASRASEGEAVPAE